LDQQIAHLRLRAKVVSSDVIDHQRLRVRHDGQRNMTF
jgi:hypothetical protein